MKIALVPNAVKGRDYTGLVYFAVLFQKYHSPELLSGRLIPNSPMDAALSNAVYAPLSVKFGCRITAQMPRELALKLADGLEQDVEDGLAGGYAVTARVVLEY